MNTVIIFNNFFVKIVFITANKVVGMGYHGHLIVIVTHGREITQLPALKQRSGLGYNYFVESSVW